MQNIHTYFILRQKSAARDKIYLSNGFITMKVLMLKDNIWALPVLLEADHLGVVIFWGGDDVTYWILSLLRLRRIAFSLSLSLSLLIINYCSWEQILQ